MVGKQALCFAGRQFFEIAKKEEKIMKKLILVSLIAVFAIVAISSVPVAPVFAGGWSPVAEFNKAICKPHLSCVGIQYFPRTGKIEICYPDGRTLDSFVAATSPGRIRALKDQAMSLNSPGVHWNNSHDGYWLPICNW